MTCGSVRARFAMALRNVSEKPKAVVEALRSASLPHDGREFLEFLENRRKGQAGKRDRPSWQVLDSPAASDAWEQAERTIDACAKHGIRALAVGDPCFPKRLAELQIDGPGRGVSLGGYCPILYFKGATEALNPERAAAIIGTREPTAFGREEARAFGSRLAAEGIVIVSGLARGCDTEAHRGCVAANGAGVAVMAHGLDRVYPPENMNLAAALVAHKGCLVSEYPPGTPPRRRAFGFRDRIQAALADLVIVIETPVRDGTMLTVDYARKQGRRVGCLSHPPGFADELQVAGNLQLLSENSRVTVPLRGPREALTLLRSGVELTGDRGLPGETALSRRRAAASEIESTGDRASPGRLPF